MLVRSRWRARPALEKAPDAFVIDRAERLRGLFPLRSNVVTCGDFDISARIDGSLASTTTQCIDLVV